MSDSEFGTHLRHLREQKKVSLRAVADQAGISRSALSQIELGQVSPTIRTVSEIAGVLGIRAADLVNEENFAGNGEDRPGAGLLPRSPVTGAGSEEEN